MSPITYAMALRFRRLGVWAPAVLLPAVMVGAAFLVAPPEGIRGPEARSASALLACLHHLLPPLAAVFLLAPSEQDGMDLLLSRPVGWTGILLSRWLAAVSLFGGCHLALALALFGALTLSGGGPGGRMYQEPTARFLGADAAPRKLLRPWPRGSPDPAWIAALTAGKPWAFQFAGLTPGRPHHARVWPLIARVITDESHGKVERELARASSLQVSVAFGGRPEEGARELRDEGPLELPVPKDAVGPEGTLRVALTPLGEEPGKAGEVTWGPPFFWFDPDPADPLLARDLRIVIGEVPFAANAFRASLHALGELLLVSALACAAGALFSPGIAIGLTLLFYLSGSAMPFLRDVVDSLSYQSSLSLLRDPAAAHSGGAPTAFDRGLRSFLAFLTTVLPDFDRFRAGRALAEGEAVRLGAVLRSAVAGTGYVLASLALAFLFLRRREVRR